MTAPRAGLDELGRLLAEATPGPWEDVPWEPANLLQTIRSTSEKRHVGRVEIASANDAALIAALVNAAPALLAEVAELRETVARVKAEVRSEDAHAVLYGVTGTHPESYGGVTKDEALECAGELLARLTAALDGAQ